MRIGKKHWLVILLGTLAVLLLLCGGTVRAVDPFFHYHAPSPEGDVWFDQRAQSAGLLRTQDYETVLMGSSLAANYRAAWFDVFYDTSTVKVTFPNGGFDEFSKALEFAFSQQAVHRVIFGLDPNLLARSPAEAPNQLPAYLYDDDPWNDGQYLLNKDALLRAVYTARCKAARKTQPLQDAFLLDGSIYFSRELALAGYQRPETASPMLPSDALAENCRANLAVVEGWLETHPDTEFIFYFAPYSILFWDKMQRTGELEAMLSLLEEATGTLLNYDNAQLQFFMGDRAIITDLDNYADHIHAAGRVTYAMARAMPTGAYRMRADNRAKMLDDLRQLVVHYDYDRIWEENPA